MRIAIPRETAAGERRVAVVPEGAARLVKAGFEVVVQPGAGVEAGFPDALYTEAGATLAASPELYEGADLVARVRAPTLDEAGRIPRGAALLSLLQAAHAEALLALLAERGVAALALERVPRTTKAQAMDVLSSQATIAGYKAVLLGASHLSKLLPMMTTAAGTLAPARAIILGAGVAGLQAIATARRLGAVVSGFDVRAAAAEQVQSLGATFVSGELVSGEAEASGGYAKAQSGDEQARIRASLAPHLAQQDLVVTTAQIPGRPAPLLIDADAVAAMRPGSVIVDLAAEAGGNCALTRAGETVVSGGVTILGPVQLAASVPFHASQMFSRNVEAFIRHAAADGTLRLDPADAIAGPMLAVAPAAPPAGATNG